MSAKRIRLQSIVLRYPTTTALVEDMTRKTYWTTGPVDPDWPMDRQGLTHMRQGVLFDVEDVLTDTFPMGHNYRNIPQRWKRFCQLYLPDSFLPWLESFGDVTSKAEIPLSFSDDGSHKIAGCLSFLSFHRYPFPTITLVSRSMRLFPMGVLDINLVALIARYFRERGFILPNQPVALSWFVPQFQLALVHGVSYLDQLGLLETPGPSTRMLQRSLRWTNRMEIRRSWEVYELNRVNGFQPWYPTGIWKKGRPGEFLTLCAELPLPGQPT